MKIPDSWAMGPGNPTCAARYYDTSAHTTTPKDQNLSDESGSREVMPAEHPGRRAELGQLLYRAVTRGHAGGTPRQARGARSAPSPCSHERSCRRNTQAGARS
ncbi:hypothetical protein Bbelb_054290 [Branchiostoma belcheri]|nr:hypothetical protein Bbelb_054290 [Branchiostoma belcheri]